MKNNTISLTDFTRENDTATFAAAMAYLRQHPGSTLLVPPGTYHITGEKAKNAMECVFNGVWGRNPQRTMFNPKYEYDIGISFEGQKGTTVIADGATLMVEGFMEPISLKDCEDVTLKGFTVDHLRKPYSHGTVRELSEADQSGVRHCIIEFDENSPITENTTLDIRYLFYSMTAGKDLFQVYMPSHTFIDSHHIKADLIAAPDLRDGDRFYTTHVFHARPGILIERAKNITLEDITIHSHAGMGIVGNRSHNVTVRRLSVIPAPGHHMSTNTDATHFTSMTGKLRLEDCRFEGQGDDFTNVHVYYQAIVGKEGEKTYYLQEKTPDGTHAQTLDYPDIGDTMELTSRRTLECLGSYTVVDCVPMHEEWMCKVTLDRPLPEDTEELMLADVTRLPFVEIVGCHARRHLARSVLLKVRGALVENNTLIETMGTAIVLAAEAGWYEGVTPANITVRGNTIVDCGLSWSHINGIMVKAECKEPKGQTLRNIVIENNIITHTNGRPGIEVCNTEGLVIRDNDIRCGGDVDIVVRDCKDIDFGDTDMSRVLMTDCQ